MATVLGGKIRAERKRLGLTLDELAERTGSSKSYIWELENRPVVRPSADKISKIAEQLGVPVEFLLDNDKVQAAPSDFDQAFFRRYEKLDPAKKEKLKTILDLLDDE